MAVVAHVRREYGRRTGRSRSEALCRSTSSDPWRSRSTADRSSSARASRARCWRCWRCTRARRCRPTGWSRICGATSRRRPPQRWSSCAYRSCARRCPMATAAPRSSRAGAATSCGSGDGELDASRFERLVADGNGRARRSALWRGAPLGDVADEPFAGRRDPAPGGTAAERARARHRPRPRRGAPPRGRGRARHAGGRGAAARAVPCASGCSPCTAAPGRATHSTHIARHEPRSSRRSASSPGPSCAACRRRSCARTRRSRHPSAEPSRRAEVLQQRVDASAGHAAAERAGLRVAEDELAGDVVALQVARRRSEPPSRRRRCDLPVQGPGILRRRRRGVLLRPRAARRRAGRPPGRRAAAGHHRTVWQRQVVGAARPGCCPRSPAGCCRAASLDPVLLRPGEQPDCARSRTPLHAAPAARTARAGASTSSRSSSPPAATRAERAAFVDALVAAARDPSAARSLSSRCAPTSTGAARTTPSLAHAGRQPGAGRADEPRRAAARDRAARPPRRPG